MFSSHNLKMGFAYRKSPDGTENRMVILKHIQSGATVEDTCYKGCRITLDEFLTRNKNPKPTYITVKRIDYEADNDGK